MPETDSSTKQSPARPGVGAVDVSVVMPVRNEGAHIEHVIRGLQTQDLGDLQIEILVVDGESDDNTVGLVQAMASSDPRIRVLSNPQRLSSAARALGVSSAQGRYVAIVDGHCTIPSRTLLADMVDLFERKQADCLSRPQPLVPGKQGYMARAIAAARTSPFGHSTRSTIYDESERAVEPTSAGAMYRREVFEQVGNFDASFDACEDVEFNYRCAQAGLVCWTSPKLAIQYEPRRTLKALWRQLGRYGLGRARLHRKHPSSFSIEPLIPAGFVLGVPISIASALLLPPPWRWMPAALYALYVVLDVIASTLTAAKRGGSLWPALLVVFPTIHAALGWGYLKGRFTSPPRIEEHTS